MYESTQPPGCAPASRGATKKGLKRAREHGVKMAAWCAPPAWARVLIGGIFCLLMVLIASR